MFDHYNVTSGGSRYMNVTVTEKRAPTDESLRLVKEIEEKLEAQRLMNMPLKNNILEGRFHACVDSTLQYGAGLRLGVDLQINGRKFTTSVIQEWNEDIDDVVVRLRDTLAKDIASRFLTENITTEVNQAIALVKIKRL